MDALLAIGLFLLPFAALYVFVQNASFPEVPGPSLRDYLPGGDVFRILQDSKSILRTIVALTRKHGDLFQMWLGPTHFTVSAYPADIAHILGNNTDFGRPIPMIYMLETSVPGSLLTMPKNLHARSRRHLRHSFNPSMLEGFHPRMSEASEELFQTLSDAIARTPEGEPSAILDFTEELSVTTFRAITNVAFSCTFDRDTRIAMGSRTNVFIDEMLSELLGYPFRQSLSLLGLRKQYFSARDDLTAFCERILTERLNETVEQRNARPSDLLDAIVTMEDQTKVDRVSQVVAFAIAGFHTTNITIAWCIYECCCNPHIVKEIQKEITVVCENMSLTEPLTHEHVKKLTYLRYVFKETLRLHPPGGFLMRVALKDTVLKGSGLTLKKGSHAIACVLSAQTSEKIWSEPKAFKPERWGPDMEGQKAPPGSYVPFSIGPSNCAGQFFAEYEGLLLLAELYRRFEFSLGCKPEEVVSCSGWVESGRSASIPGGDFDNGIPVCLKRRVG